MSDKYNLNKELQTEVLAMVYQSKEDSARYLNFIKPKYFEYTQHIDVCRLLLNYYNDYGVMPTKALLLQLVDELCDSSKVKTKLKDEYVELVNNMSSYTLDNINYLEKKLEDFGKSQALTQAIVNSADILKKEKDANKASEQILQEIAKATNIGLDKEDYGLQVFDNISDSINMLLQGEDSEDILERLPTGLKELDKRLKGGIARSEMAVVLAPPGLGKTTCLISMAGNMIKRGYRVLHISLENNELQILRSYLTRILQKPVEYIRENPDLVKKSLETFMKNAQSINPNNVNDLGIQANGLLRIKKFEAKSVTARDLRNYIDKVNRLTGEIYDVIVVDYGTLLKPSRGAYVERRIGIEENYEELRAMADHYNCALLTAAQANRSSLNKKVVSMKDLAEAFAIANTADVMVALCQTVDEKEQGIMRMFLTKVRDGESNVVLKGTVDHSIKTITMTETVEVTEEDLEEDNRSKRSKKKKKDYEDSSGYEDWDA